MPIGDKAGLEAAQLAVKELGPRLDRVAALLEDIKRMLESKEVVIKLEDRR